MTGANPSAPRSRLRPADLLPVGTVGPRARPLRAGLSALGVAIGIAAIVAVLSITRSSQADLLAQIDRLGTDLLTVVNGRSIEGQEAELPAPAGRMLGRLEGVRHVAPTAQLEAVSVYRTDKVPAFLTGALAVRACDLALLATLNGHLRQGGFLNPASARYPATVVGYQAAKGLGIAALDQPTRIWLGGHPSRIYVRTDTEQTTAVAALLAPTADPVHPEQVRASRPSDALTARVAAKRATTGLFLGLGAVALLVGGIGIANVMVIGVLGAPQRDRPAPGARRHPWSRGRPVPGGVAAAGGARGGGRRGRGRRHHHRRRAAAALAGPGPGRRRLGRAGGGAGDRRGRRAVPGAARRAPCPDRRAAKRVTHHDLGDGGRLAARTGGVG